MHFNKYNLMKIGFTPCKIRTGILAGIPPGSRPDFGCQNFYSQQESRRDQNSLQPKSRRDPATNLAEILAGKQKS